LIGAAIGGGSAALTGGDFGDVLTGAALGAAGGGVSGSLSSGATGGSFLESLGTDTLSSLSTGLSIFSGLSSVAGGFAARGEAEKQSELALQQAGRRAAEEERVAFRQAELEEERADRVRRKQKVAYLASGVTLEGSPLLTMEETTRRGAENVEEIKKAGSASARAVREEGRITAQKLQSSGRQQFTSGLSSGVRSIASGVGLLAQD